jgi:hypothetical protein
MQKESRNLQACLRLDLTTVLGMGLKEMIFSTRVGGGGVWGVGELVEWEGGCCSSSLQEFDL